MMILESIIPMSVFAFVTSATPGPVNLISSMSGAKFGPLRSIPYVLGATVSFTCILLLLGGGFGFVIEWVKKFSLIFTLLGSLYMFYIVWRIIMQSRGNFENNQSIMKPPGFLTGFLTQALNPKAWFVSLAAISIYIMPYEDFAMKLYIFSFLFFMICAGSLMGWVMIGYKLANLTNNVQIFNVTMAALLLISIVYILVQEFVATFGNVSILLF